MGIREWTNNHPKAAGGVVGGCILVCIGAIVANAMGNRRGITTTMPDEYYTVDDGKTYFAASESNVPPFSYQGQTAVRAYVFDSNGKKVRRLHGPVHPGSSNDTDERKRRAGLGRWYRS